MKSTLLLSLMFVGAGLAPASAETSADPRIRWLTVDRKTEKVIYNSEFYAMKHFSATVRPAARRIAVRGGSFKEVVAFQNPDGGKVLAFANGGHQTVSATVQVSETFFRLGVPAKSINTVWLL